MAANRKCRVALRLTKEEARKLAGAIRQSAAPSRSFLVLESIQGGLQTRRPIRVQGRRKIFPICLPMEVKQAVQQLALELHVTQQELLRHFLRTYLESKPWKRTSRPCAKKRQSEHTQRRQTG